MSKVVSENSQNFQIEPQQPQWYRALWLAERLASLRTRPPSQETEKTRNIELAQRKLQRWQASFQKSIDFTTRLEAEHIAEDDLLTLLGETSADLQQRTTTPDWLIQLAQVFTDVPDLPDQAIVSTDAEQPAKFSLLNVVDSFILYGCDRLQRSVAALVNEYDEIPFDISTVATLFLPSLLSSFNIIARTMVLELHVARLEERLQGETAEERFQDFVRQTRQKNRLLPLLEEYPVLARVLIMSVNRWASYSLECLRHLCADWRQITATFAAAGDPGMLVEVEGDAGDTHRGGRSVLKLKFNSGLRLVYKPKSLAIDIHFQELLAWLNERGSHPPFRAITLLDRGSYGWSEYIEAQNCATEAEVARFYERQGAYLALLYVLNATDLHYENLIAAGEHPILVDLEALFHPRLERETASLNDVALDALQYSVVRVGLLPRRIYISETSDGMDISGLGGHDGQKTPMLVFRWKDTGTDQMKASREHGLIHGEHNLPRIGEEVIGSLEYRDHIVIGFQKLYRLLIEYRDELISGPLALFASDEIRCIVRATQFYWHLLVESFHPDLLRDALDRDRHFDQVWAAAKRHPRLALFAPSERLDLLAGDIPMFTTCPDTRDLYSSRGERISDFLEQTGLEAVQQTLLNLDEQDLERQTWFIEASFTSTQIGQNLHAWKCPTVSVPTGKAATRERLLAQACAIGDHLCARAIRNEQGANWVGLNLFQERQWVLVPALPNLYDGNIGILLFLAYLWKITGDTRYRDIVEVGCMTMRRQVEQMKDEIKTVGAFDGWGSVIYLLSHLGVLWNDQNLFAEAREVATLLPELIEQDVTFDVLSGSAGCILSLLSLYRVAPSPSLLATTVQCGERLISMAQPARSGMAWRNPAISSRPLAGFSHGAAGCALSLLALAEVSGEERFQRMALEALAYERSVFSAQAGNWPDFRELTAAGTPSLEQKEDLHYMVSWCHGAPGIAMGRLAALHYLDDEALRQEIRIALVTTIKQGFGLNHSLCHGDLGNLEALLLASRMLQDKQYSEHLDHFSRLILDSIEVDGWLTGIPLGVEAPGLMMGLAGIGYELLRLTEPERVPSVLLLDPPMNSNK